MKTENEDGWPEKRLPGLCQDGKQRILHPQSPGCRNKPLRMCPSNNYIKHNEPQTSPYQTDNS